LSEVPWFPRHISELDMIANRVLDAGTDLHADHPGFHDQIYRQRRHELADFAMNHKWNKQIAEIHYTENEIKCWTAVWDRMQPLLRKYACKEYLQSLDLMVKHCNYDRTSIPRQSDISNFLESTTNFKLRPVAGLLSSRDFLNGLAHRTFFCTQYIRVSQSIEFVCNIDG
jgi:phenylalanine-4-hydroxylase